MENKFSGLLYDNEIFQPLETGMRLKAYVKQVREDGKIDWFCKSWAQRRWMIFRKCYYNILKIMKLHSIE